jgi:hypothetical protein
VCCTHHYKATRRHSRERCRCHCSLRPCSYRFHGRRIQWRPEARMLEQVVEGSQRTAQASCTRMSSEGCEGTHILCDPTPASARPRHAPSEHAPYPLSVPQIGGPLPARSRGRLKGNSRPILRPSSSASSRSP